jgi:hypothetical protein
MQAMDHTRQRSASPELPSERLRQYSPELTEEEPWPLVMIDKNDIQRMQLAIEDMLEINKEYIGTHVFSDMETSDISGIRNRRRLWACLVIILRVRRKV